MEVEELKTKILKMLREDEEFRYAVAGILGLEEIIRRLEKHDEKFNEILERLDRHEEELKKLREDMNHGFRRQYEILEMHTQEIIKLREDMNKLREDMMLGFKRHDEILERHEREIIKLREDMNKGFQLLSRHIDALGARWGIMSEEAFREGLRGLLERELGFKIEKWTVYDQSGKVYGYPSMIDIDIILKDEKTILVEVSSHIKKSDIVVFMKKAELYEEKTGRKPNKLLVVTPYIDEEALKASEMMEIEVYTKV
jgi:hypothetical protein